MSNYSWPIELHEQCAKLNENSKEKVIRNPKIESSQKKVKNSNKTCIILLKVPLNTHVSLLAQF